MAKLDKTRLVFAIVVTGIVVLVSLILFPEWQGTGFWGMLALFALAFVGVTMWLANSLKAYRDDKTIRNPNAAAAATYGQHSPNIVSTKQYETVDMRNVINAHFDFLKSVRAETSQVQGLITKVQYSEEMVLIKSEIRYLDQDILVKEIQQQPLQQYPTRFPSKFDLAYQERLREANSVSLSILVFGPSKSDSDLYRKRVQIRNTLQLLGHDARFCEDFQVPPQQIGALTLKQQEIIQARLADLIIILYSSFGSIAETHDIGNLNDLKMKLLILVDQQHTGSYGAQGLLMNLQRYNRIYAYATEELRTCSLMTRILKEVDCCRAEKSEDMKMARSN